VTVGGEAFVPGSAFYITATQAVAISSLYYLYTGRVLSRASALAILPTFAAEAVGSTLFLWVSSFLAPGPQNIVAATVAMSITAAMLLSVNSILAAGAEIHEARSSRLAFSRLRGQLKATVAAASWKELVTESFWKKVVHDLMYA